MIKMLICYNLFIFVPVGFASHAKQVVSMQVKPRRKELPLIEGQVPKDAGVEGMHPIDFKAFWEQSLFKFLSSIQFAIVNLCSFVPVAFAASLQALGSKRFSHDLSCYFTPWEVQYDQYVWHWFCIGFALVLQFYMFWFYKINQNNAALVRLSPKNFRILWCAQAIQSLGISKI